MLKKVMSSGAFLLFTSAMVGSAVAAPQQDPMVSLGRAMYMDKDFSYNSTQSCLTCHSPQAGFADPTNSRDPFHTVVSLGADGVSKGGRNAPTAAYAGYSPALHWDSSRSVYVGGMFWDGRATGDSLNLADPLAEQAQGPPLNPVEMNMPSVESIVQVVRDSVYADRFLQVFGAQSLDNADNAYDDIARAIAAFERSARVQQFSADIDVGPLNGQQSRGQVLFEANCAKCHSSQAEYGAPAPLFTNYGYYNIGVPVNPLLADNPIDYGLGGFLGDAAENGKFKVPTLRNVALTAPYSHNGYFATLTDMVRFHNSRDTGTWPEPEVMENLNTTDVGSMGLGDGEIADLVAFLESLTDN